MPVEAEAMLVVAGRMEGRENPCEFVCWWCDGGILNKGYLMSLKLMVGETVVFVDGPQRQMRKLSFCWSRDPTCLLYIAESRVNGRLMRGIVIHDMVVDGSIVLDTVQFINLIARALHPVYTPQKFFRST
jgi:hypothetical protein